MVEGKLVDVDERIEAGGSNKPPVCCKYWPPILSCWGNRLYGGKSSEEGSETGVTEGRGMVVGCRRRKPGGWKTMPFILGNETCERLASFSLLSNFMVYLLREYHMDQASAANLLNIWSGCSNFTPLIGAFLADAYMGRFWVIAAGSFACILGMLTLTMTAWIPGFKPPSCTTTTTTNPTHCVGPTTSQLLILITGLSLQAIGTGGIRPCSIPFGVDQFDLTTPEGRRGIDSYYNWYYATFNAVVVICLTVMVYVQDQVSWILGFGIPALLMLISITIFFLGARRYIIVAPEGSVFSSIAEVLVSAYHKRHRITQLPPNKSLHQTTHAAGVHYNYYYDPDPTPEEKGIINNRPSTKLQLTDDYKFLNKAAVVIDESEIDGNSGKRRVSKWRLTTTQRVEEVKCLIRVLPIWVSGVICFTAAIQQGTFTVSQALIMNRKVGSFEIPAGSIAVISMFTIGIWLPFYDRVVVPILRRFTNRESGITHLQRMGIGLLFAVTAMIVAGLVEQKRRNYWDNSHHHLSVFWLIPQLVLMGMLEGFNFIAQIEFYNTEFPESMSSVATALFFCSFAGANYVGSLLIMLVHRFSGGNDDNWLANDLNKGRLDCFYYLLAGLAVVNIGYFLYVSSKYKYKASRTEKVNGSMEMGSGIVVVDVEKNGLRK